MVRRDGASAEGEVVEGCCRGEEDGGAAHRRAQQPREGEPSVEPQGALPRRRRPEGRVRAEGACVATAGRSLVLAAGQGWVRTYLVAVSLVAVLTGANAITCYKSDVIYDSEKWNLEPSTEVECPASSSFCITKIYEQGFAAHECSKDFQNCSALGVEKAGVDRNAPHMYSCCNSDKCNTKSLRLPEVADGVDIQTVRPDCDSWLPKNYDVNDAGYSTDANALKQDFSVDKTNQRSKWSFGVQPPTAASWLYTRDASTPACYSVSGQIQSGFCGVRYNVDADGNRAKNQFGDFDVTFQGKYYNTYCGGSNSEKLALADDFTLVNRDLNREKCMSTLSESGLKSDCESILGQYNLDVFMRKRRALLPDCCVGYVETRPKNRLVCDCDSDGSTPLTEICAQVCCCETAILGKVPEDRCATVKEYIDLSVALERLLRDQCCFSRMVSQCETDDHCNDAISGMGRVPKLSTFPLCCTECENYYDEICSYNRILPTGEEGDRVSMRSTVLYDGLKALCKRKLCRTEYPCSFIRQATATKPSGSWLLALALPSLLLFV